MDFSKVDKHLDNFNCLKLNSSKTEKNFTQEIMITCLEDDSNDMVS